MAEAQMLNKGDLIEYLTYCITSPGAQLPGGYKECGPMLQEVLHETRWLEYVAPGLLIAVLAGPETLFISAWATGFSMGVEFERRRAQLSSMKTMMEE